MKKIAEKFSNSLLRAKLALDNFMSDERGDTNFISIAIILVVVIVIAIVFITFGQDLTEELEKTINNLFRVL